MKKRFDIAVVGNILADVVKRIDAYPAQGMLANILDLRRSVGGCVPNVGIDLKKISPALSVAAIGKVGEDDVGEYVVGEMEKAGMDTSLVLKSALHPTSFSDVMSLPTGERTFFHARGANAHFSPEEIDTEAFDCRLLHAGYLLLLDEFDQKDAETGTKMARFLKKIQEKGILTSIDVVSDATADFPGVILPSLKYTDLFIVNETESAALSGFPPYAENGALLPENIEKTARFLAESGVKKKVVIHCKKAGFCLDVPTGEFTVQSSLALPRSLMKGSVGAGDAFCAGFLFSFLQGYDDLRALQFAAAAAAASLLAENSVDGMKEKNKIEEMIETYGWEA